MSIYLNELTVLPAACQIFLQQPPHPDTLAASHLFLPTSLSSALPPPGGLDPFGVGAPNGIGTLCVTAFIIS